MVRAERPGSGNGGLEIWGYVGRPSYAAGETLTAHVCTNGKSFDVRIWRFGARHELVHEIKDCAGTWHETPPDAYANGCGWPASVSVTILPEWRSGAYLVEFVATDAGGSAIQDGFFILRPSRGQQSRIALLLSTYTWQEYNDWGGGSGYNLDALGGLPLDGPDERLATPGSQRSAATPLQFSPRLSFQRPWARGFVRLPLGAPRIPVSGRRPAGWAVRLEHAEWAFANGYARWSANAGWARYDGLFVEWAERSGYAIDVLSQWDLDQVPGLLSGYECVVSVGHDEYWTAAGRDELDDFIERGGRYARFAGNIAWQVRLEDDGRTLVCYKDAPSQDPLGAGPKDLRTGAFESPEIAKPPVTTFGANGSRGIYARVGGSSPRGVGGFIIYRNDHWVFDGTDLYYGDVLGASVPLVGYEVDGVTYTFRDGLPLPTGEDGTPADLQILALTPATLDEEDHGNSGSLLQVGDADLAGAAKMLLGSDSHEARERVRRGAAVMTWMRKGDGAVFSGGTTEWPYALSEEEAAVERVVRNVLDQFSALRN